MKMILILTTINFIPFVCGQYVFTYEVPDENRAPRSELFDPSKYKYVPPSQLQQHHLSTPSSIPATGTLVPSRLPYQPPHENYQPVTASPAPPQQPHLTREEQEEARRSLIALQELIKQQHQFRKQYEAARNVPPPTESFDTPKEYRRPESVLPSSPPPESYSNQALPPREFYSSPTPPREYYPLPPHYNPNHVDLRVIERPPQPQPTGNHSLTLASPQGSNSPSKEASLNPPPSPHSFASPLLNSFLSQHGTHQHQPQAGPIPGTPPPYAQAVPASPSSLQQPYLYHPQPFPGPQGPIHPEPHNNVVLRVIQRRPALAPQPNHVPYFQPHTPPHNNVVLRVIQRRPQQQYPPELAPAAGPVSDLQTSGQPKFQTAQEAIRDLREKQLFEHLTKQNNQSPATVQPIARPTYNTETVLRQQIPQQEVSGRTLPQELFLRQAYQPPPYVNRVPPYDHNYPSSVHQTTPQLTREAYQTSPQLSRESYQTNPQLVRQPYQTNPRLSRETYQVNPELTRQPYQTSLHQHSPSTYDVINRQSSALSQTARLPSPNYLKPVGNEIDANRLEKHQQFNTRQITTKRPRTTTTYKPANIAVAALPPDDDRDGIAGIAGKDYPNLATIPRTSFSCAKQPLSGYYADTETACQVVHVCQAGGLQDSFLCPNGTIFNQEKFACQWWYEANCGLAPRFYALNDNLYRKDNKK
ncbi:mediator of RNA polymerase II transcription subunit 15-like protein [Dinothrombium tinctorium]|uniref:Mediator of RNA polymerase II transcription subunit 15-like protein n=1 Tax=Dinothrombium tinctorium TaxID=1965070 RepID=A0A443RPU4_9ACAR|nr:mediator of RNA polymerase II transcription subunit 15-like protein [Dinothrombium tinctorium]